MRNRLKSAALSLLLIFPITTAIPAGESAIEGREAVNAEEAAWLQAHPAWRFLPKSGSMRPNEKAVLTERDLSALANFPSSIPELVLDAYYLQESPEAITDAGLSVIGGLRGLRHLVLTLNARVTDEGLAHLADLTDVRELDLDHGENITAAGLAGLSPLKELRTLTLRRMPDAAAAGLGALLDGIALETLSLSSALSTGSAGNAMGGAWLAAVGHGTTLRNVAIYHVDLTGERLSSLRHLTALEKLHVGCTTISDRDLEVLKEHKTLRRLEITSNPDGVSDGDGLITDDGLAHLAMLPRLEALRLWRVTGITDNGLASVAAMASLRHLNIGGCVKITDEGLSHLARLTELETLDMSELKNITDDGLAPLAFLRNLKHLNMRYCPEITGRGLAHLAVLERLESLNLEGCFKIEGPDLPRLAPIKSLRTLHLRRMSGFEGDPNVKRLEESIPGCRVFIR